MDAFKSADQVLLSGVQGITDLITTPGLINLDFADVKSVMSGAGSALMGIGSSRGDNRAVQAAEMAVASPLLEASMDGAHGVLLSVSGGSDLGLFEINEAASLVADAAHADANIIFGAVIDDALGDEVRVTVIAAGFDSGAPTYKKAEAAPETEAPSGNGSNGVDSGDPHNSRPLGGLGRTEAGSAPARSYESASRSYDSPSRSYETPARTYESTRRYESPSSRPSNGSNPLPPTTPAPVSSASVPPSRPAPRRVEFEEDLDLPDFLKNDRS
jgi:cell division protein FtsZ